MNTTFKRILGVITSTVVVGLTIFALWIGYFFYLMVSGCTNDILQSVSSPSGDEKAVVFLRNCGATTDWTVHASVLSGDKAITNSDVGNIMRINSDHGRAHPLASNGWPIIIAKWENPRSLTLHYSKDSAILYQNDKIQDVSVQFVPMTSQP